MVSPPGMGTSHFGGSLHESGVSVIMERYLTGGVKRKVGRRSQGTSAISWTFCRSASGYDSAVIVSEENWETSFLELGIDREEFQSLSAWTKSILYFPSSRRLLWAALEVNYATLFMVNLFQFSEFSEKILRFVGPQRKWEWLRKRKGVWLNSLLVKHSHERSDILVFVFAS